MSGNSKNAWTLKSKGIESAFGGNEGYPDSPQSHYIYDTTVKNHDKVGIGDLIVITGKKQIIGIATIEDIKIENNISKVRFRCPICRNQEISVRKNITPKYKCRKKHEFDEPVTQEIVVTRYSAYYGSSFKPASGLATNILKPYFVKHNLYYSIQKMQLSFFQDYFPGLTTHYAGTEKKQDIIRKKIQLPLLPYEPDNKDERGRKSRIQPTRQGQEKFRAGLFEIYGVACMLTGCTVARTLEASHINPYRGLKDHHLENGFLFRKDFHALFDSNLMGVNPETLTIHLHPTLKTTCYEEFDGQRLTINRDDFGPSKQAMMIRWEIFCSACQDQRLRIPPL
ncbi:HNH endonuclease [Chitinophaga niabensis]|uniref:HNH endonuclease n=1 Tax=Chitinophaga niabensis TaxID=536979 RepID=UPI0031BA36CE